MTETNRSIETFAGSPMISWLGRLPRRYATTNTKTEGLHYFGEALFITIILFSLNSLSDTRSMAVNGSHRALARCSLLAARCSLLAACCSLLAAQTHLSDVVAVSDQHHGRHNFPAVCWSRAGGLSDQMTGSLELISGNKVRTESRQC